jgi:hypothetical protein
MSSARAISCAAVQISHARI